jgi:diguanylate cyclase (GGDEF)-like protein
MTFKEWFLKSPPTIRREHYRFYLFLNYIFIFTFIGHLAFLIPLYTLLGNRVAFWSDTVCLLADLSCFLLIRRGRIKTSFVIFVTAISAHTILSILVFGNTTSLPLYFYTLLVMVFLSPWPLKSKVASASVLILLAIVFSCYSFFYPPRTALSHIQLIFWNSSNILANGLALSFGVYFFSFIADTAEQYLRYQAEHDLLTGILNRHAIFQFLISTLRQVKAQGRELSIIMGDIDHFKRVNDSYGHLVGDEVLKRVAHTLGVTLRTGDALGRFGGEEFVIVLPNCQKENALRIAERIRATLVAETVLTSAGEIPVSMSFGVASVHDLHAESSDSLIARADQALYLAKNNGRNRVEYA